MKVKRNLLLCSWLSFFLLISVLPGNASVFAQQEKLALSSTQLTVREIFDAISSQLRYDVFYNGEQLDLNRKVKFAQQVLNLEQVLDAVANNRFKYTLEDRTIILTPLTTPQTVNSVTLTGQVTDQSNTPLPGVTVLVKGTKLGTSTDPEGNFKLSLPQQENTILIFSFIGMESQEVPVGDPKKPIKVILKETAENLKEVVVTGIFTRKKESFTGSVSTYTASELKTAGTQNILQSLKTLDPSFAILDVPNASTMVTMELNASGIAATANATANRNASAAFPPLNTWTPNRIPQKIRIRIDKLFPNWSRLIWRGVFFSDAFFNSPAIFPTSVSIPIPVTRKDPLP